jgi:hypothetical protein
MPIQLTPRDATPPGRELPGAPLADLVTQLAEAVAEGQAKLDLSAAGVAKQLAETRVQFVPAIRQIIDEKGNMKFETAKPVEVSLLELGLQPTFYAFAGSDRRGGDGFENCRRHAVHDHLEDRVVRQHSGVTVGTQA